MDVVLIHPDIPPNTGNIGRTCVATGTRLHLVGPMGFSLDDRFLKRSGLDYWERLDLTLHGSVRDFLESPAVRRPLFLFSRFAKRSFWEASFPEDAVLLFGSETAGLPVPLKRKFASRLYRIPTAGPVRSLNLATAVGIVLFEALRQRDRVKGVRGKQRS
jgi:tRNA (cytidine/uridine-2'-O-)-methyltransferase